MTAQNTMSPLRILNWNAAGAKFLSDTPGERSDFFNKFNSRLEALIQQYEPHFILLQEVARWDEGSGLSDLVRQPEGYGYHASIAIDTVRQAHPARWRRVRDKGEWPDGVYLGQGYGILWREKIAHCPIWDLPKPSQLAVHNLQLDVEEIFMATGLYTGDRDTEPRLAVVAHFVVGDDAQPRDVFIINLHLTTLRGEREGFPDRDDLGSQIRLGQIDVVLRGIVSRYNAWWHDKKQKEKMEKMEPLQVEIVDRLPPIWFIAGDFNCTPESPEIVKMKRMNFLDLNLAKGAGNKGHGRPPKPEITVDYIFAGPMYWAFDPHAVEPVVRANQAPLTDVAISDHFPVIASFPI